MKQGEIWSVSLDPSQGVEIKKTRPALIINVNALGKLPLKIIVPITDWKEHYRDYPWMVKIEPNKTNGLDKLSAIDCFQVRSVSINRLTTFWGTVSNRILFNVQDAIAKVIGVEQ